MTRVLCPAALALLALPCTAVAQSQGNGPSSVAKANEDAVASGDAVAPEHLSGDWNGARTSLVQQGIELKPSYLAEVADVASGGERRGADYAHQIKLQADIDLETLTGWKGWSLHGTLLERAGRNASADYLGDDLDEVQEIYGATDHAAAHLGYLYLEHASGDRVKVNTKLGRMPVGLDFAASPLYCNFLSLGLCPEPRGLSINGSFSVDPSSTWGARARVSPKGFYAMAGAYQARPRYGGPSGFDWGFSHSTGLVLPAEIGWAPKFGTSQLQGHYKIGLTYDTSNYPDILPSGAMRGHRRSYYVLADQMLMRTGKNGTDGLILFGGWTHADAATSVFRDFSFVGLAASGLIAARPHDSIDALITRGSISPHLTEAQQLAEMAGTKLPTGFPPAAGAFGPTPAAPGVQTCETIYELAYGIHAANGMKLTPDLQYVARPGATRSLPNAWVVAGRLEIDF